MLAGQVWESIFRMPQIVIVGGLAVGCLVSIVGIFAHYWHKTEELRLKQTLVKQGLSADEIEQIIGAGQQEQSDA